MFKKKKWVLQNSEDGGDGSSGSGATLLDNAIPAGAATPAPQSTPVTPAAGAAAGAATPVTPPATPEPVKALWPDDWRKVIAGEDEKELKRPGRFATPADVHKAYRALEQRLSAGELKSALPKDAKPEEIAQWRKDNGIPETPDKYDIKLEKNFVIGEDDKPFVDEFLKSAHAKNMTPDQVNGAVQWYMENQAKQAEMRAAKDETDRMSTLDTLNGEWGNGFRQNVNMIGGVLSRFPQGVQDAIKSARLPDGTALFNHPDVLRGFVAMALEINPAAALVPQNGADPMKGIDDEISTIEKFMKENRREYNKDEKMQAKYRDLLVAREKIGSRK